MKDAALSYVKRGWLVLPLHSRDMTITGCSCLNRNCTSPAKHPRTLHGVKDASRDPEYINKWWDMWPGANVGIACGRDTGIVVIDVDPRNGGVETMQSLLKGHILPQTVTAYTGGSGFHFYFAYPTDGIPKQTLGPGVDLVSNGGYVVAAPSKHVSGKNYQWTPGRAPGETYLAMLPEWLMSLTDPTKSVLRGFALDRPTDYIAAGARNINFIRIAGAMRRWAMGYEAIEAALQIHNRQVCDPPMSKREIKTIAHNAVGYEPEESNGEAEPDEGSSIRVAHRPVVE